MHRDECENVHLDVALSAFLFGKFDFSEESWIKHNGPWPFLARFRCSWTCLKAIHSGFQLKVWLCFSVQYLQIYSISKILCMRRRRGALNKFNFAHYWLVLSVLRFIWKLWIISFRTRFCLVDLFSPWLAIQFRRFDAWFRRTVWLTPCAFIISWAFWELLDAHKR